MSKSTLTAAQQEQVKALREKLGVKEDERFAFFIDPEGNVRPMSDTPTPAGVFRHLHLNNNYDTGARQLHDPLTAGEEGVPLNFNVVVQRGPALLGYKDGQPEYGNRTEGTFRPRLQLISKTKQMLEENGIDVDDLMGPSPTYSTQQKFLDLLKKQSDVLTPVYHTDDKFVDVYPADGSVSIKGIDRKNVFGNRAQAAMKGIMGYDPATGAVTEVAKWKPTVEDHTESAIPLTSPYASQAERLNNIYSPLAILASREDDDLLSTGLQHLVPKGGFRRGELVMIAGRRFGQTMSNRLLAQVQALTSQQPSRKPINYLRKMYEPHYRDYLKEAYRKLHPIIRRDEEGRILPNRAHGESELRIQMRYPLRNRAYAQALRVVKYRELVHRLRHEQNKKHLKKAKRNRKAWQ